MREPQKSKIDKSKITGYGCNKLGHFKTECDQGKRFQRKFPSKKKSMMESWDGSNNQGPKVFWVPKTLLTHIS